MTSSPKQRTGFPRTYDASAPDDAGAGPDVFDPALKHFPMAFRKGVPARADGATADAWLLARRRVMDHLLRLVADSPWREGLVLRGSLVLTAWLGRVAREPGDIDFVVQPSSVSLGGPWSRDLFDGLAAAVTHRSSVPVSTFDESSYRRAPRVREDSPADRIRILADQTAVDDIWTYERAPGRRIVFPWRAEGLPPGSVQLDFVFGEKMGDAPVMTEIPTVDGGRTTVWTVSQAQSLAWKLLWLQTDMYPQGKDLYDATLLAERTRLPLELLERTLREGDVDMVADSALAWQVDWDNFRLEYPTVTSDVGEYKARLTRALAPTFADA